jgi:hypothetical protein
MTHFKKILIFPLAALIFTLSAGIKVYEVHCNMRNATFINLQSGIDPCESEPENLDLIQSCCAAKKTCSSETSEDNSCCEEEDITLSYQADFFEQFTDYTFDFVLFFPTKKHFEISSNLVAKNLNINQYAKPPPKSGRDYLTLYAVLRI